MFGIERKDDNRSKANTGESEPKDPDPIKPTTADHPTDETQAENSNNFAEFDSFKKGSRAASSTIQEASSNIEPDNIQNNESNEEVSTITHEQQNSFHPAKDINSDFEKNNVQNISTKSNKEDTKPNFKIPIIGKPNLLLKRRKYVPNLSTARERHCDFNRSTKMNTPKINVDNSKHDPPSIVNTAVELNDAVDSFKADDYIHLAESGQNLEESNTFQKNVSSLLTDSFAKGSQTVGSIIQEASSHLEPRNVHNSGRNEETSTETSDQNSSYPTNDSKLAYEENNEYNISTESNKEHTKPNIKIPLVCKPNLLLKRRKYVPNLSAARERHCELNRSTTKNTPQINVDNNAQPNDSPSIVSTASALNKTDDNSTDETVEIIELSDEDENLEKSNTFQKSVSTLLSDSEIINHNKNPKMTDPSGLFKKPYNVPNLGTARKQHCDSDKSTISSPRTKMNPSGLFKMPYDVPNLSTAKKQHCNSDKSTINSPQINVDINRGQSKASSSIVSTSGASNYSVNNSSNKDDITTDEIDHNIQESNKYQENVNTEAEIENIYWNTSPKTKIAPRVYKNRKLVANFSALRERESKTFTVPSPLLNVEGPCICALLDCPHGKFEKEKGTPALVIKAVKRIPSFTASSSKVNEICNNLDESTILKGVSVQNINHNYLADETATNLKESMILKEVKTGSNKESTNKQRITATIKNQKKVNKENVYQRVGPVATGNNKEVNIESNKENTNQRVVLADIGNKIKTSKQPQRKKLQVQQSCDKIKSNKKTESSNALISKQSANEENQEHDSGNKSIEEKRTTDAEKEVAQKLKDGVPKMKLTLGDLIHYNPTTNPMPDVIQEEISVEKIADEKTRESKRVRVLVPQLKVGPDGKTVFDKYSEAPETSDCGGSEVDDEELYDEDELGSMRRRRRKRQPYRRNRWNVEETIFFYKALNQFGTDFSMMENHFENRTRRDCYLKFKREEKIRLRFVDEAMVREQGKFDLNQLEEELTKKSSERKRKEEEKIRKREEKKYLRQKKKAQKLEDKIRAKKLRELISRALKEKTRKRKKEDIRKTRFVPKTMFDRDWDQDNDRIDYQSLFEVEESSQSPKAHITQDETRALKRVKKQLQNSTLQEILQFELKSFFDELDAELNEKAEQVGQSVSNVNLEHSPPSSDDSQDENVLFKDI